MTGSGTALRRPVGQLLGALLAVLLLGGCDTSVTVLNPDPDYQFSLFGTLQVTADTQVVRVEPLGDSTQVGAPASLNARIVLKNLDAGTQVALRDSFGTVGNVAPVHNAWTPHTIEPGTTYRVEVQVDGQAVTTATTTTPAQAPRLRHAPATTRDRPFELPCRFSARGTPVELANTFDLRVRGVDAVAAAEVRYPLSRPPARRPWLDHYERVEEEPEENRFRVSVFYADDLLFLTRPDAGGDMNQCPAPNQFTAPRAVVRVTAGGPDWPDWQGASLNALARPDTFSNVTGGHGFVGGVYADTIHIPIQGRE